MTQRSDNKAAVASFHQRCSGGMVVVMTKATTISTDLRHTAVTAAAAELAAGGTTPPLAAIEAGLDAATPYLLDAFYIDEALAAVNEEQVEADPYTYLRQLQQDGLLQLRTLTLDHEDADSEVSA